MYEKVAGRKDVCTLVFDVWPQQADVYVLPDNSEASYSPKGLIGSAFIPGPLQVDLPIAYIEVHTQSAFRSENATGTITITPPNASPVTLPLNKSGEENTWELTIPKGTFTQRGLTTFAITFIVQGGTFNVTFARVITVG